MGHYIVKQPNGKYAIFSSVVDHFIAYDATPEQINMHFRLLAMAEADRQTKRGLADADRFGIERLHKYLNTVRVIHGDATADEYASMLYETPTAASCDDATVSRMEEAEALCRSEGTPFSDAIADIIRNALEKI